MKTKKDTTVSISDLLPRLDPAEESQALTEAEEVRRYPDRRDAEIALLREALKKADERLWKHHDSSLCTWWGACPVCTTEGEYSENIFEVIKAALNATSIPESDEARGASRGNAQAMAPPGHEND